MNDPAHIELTLSKIHEGVNTISFSPPLKLDCYLTKNEKGDTVGGEINFDFGLSIESDLNPCYLQNIVYPPRERIKAIITFEIFHSFFHPSTDPNFSTLNWALFGNLAHRVTCEERWEFAKDPQVETWKYNNRLEKVLE
jgi:hypothetical protein